MASAKEIKKRMSSVRDMQKITNAMYLIASTKMRKAKSELELTKPYFNGIKQEIKRIFRDSEHINSKYFYPDEKLLTGRYGVLVITADKGLAGAYNQNIIKQAEKMMEDHEDTKLYVVGEYGRHYFKKHNIPIEKSFLYTAQNPTMDRAREIAHILLEDFNNGELDKIFVIYTDMKNSIEAQAISTRVLPFHHQHFDDGNTEKEVTTPFEFEPSLSMVLDGVVPGYLAGFIYSALVDSFCSEQNARMTAMNAANQNAENILADLSIEYNRVRQAAITQEITEVSAGAKAQKRKRMKKLEEAQ